MPPSAVFAMSRVSREGEIMSFLGMAIVAGSVPSQTGGKSPSVAAAASIYPVRAEPQNVWTVCLMEAEG